MALQRDFDGAEPVRPQGIERIGGTHEERRSVRGWRLGSGTLACPDCDAPIAIGAARLSPRDRLDCPYCRHRAAVRDFLSLASPTRPTRVALRVVAGARRGLD